MLRENFLSKVQTIMFIKIQQIKIVTIVSKKNLTLTLRMQHTTIILFTMIQRQNKIKLKNLTEHVIQIFTAFNINLNHYRPIIRKKPTKTTKFNHQKMKRFIKEHLIK